MQFAFKFVKIDKQYFMNDNYTYGIIAFALFVFLAYWLYKLFSLGSNKTDATTDSSSSFSKENFNNSNSDVPSSQLPNTPNQNLGSLSTVNTFLHNQELNTKKYLVKTDGSATERLFDKGSEEERLLQAEKYYSFVLQNFRFSQIRSSSSFDAGYSSIILSLICISYNNGKMEETIIKSNKEKRDR